MQAVAANPSPGTVVYECTVLKGTGKKGTMTPDADGYYTVVLGGMDVFNTKQGFYDAAESGDILNTCEVLQGRLRAGNLYGEMGHPRREPGMTDDQFTYRVHDIDEKNIAIHIAQVWEDKTNYRDPKTGKPMVAFIGKVRPDGLFKDVVIDRLTNPKQNCCFSVRCSSIDKFKNGRISKKITKIITWDVVHSPGIPVATKYGSMSLESEGFNTLSIEADSSTRLELTAEMLTRMIKNAKSGQGINLESAYRESVIADLQQMLASCSVDGRSRSW